MSYSIIIPVYKGEECVTLLFQKIRNFFLGQNYLFEVIFVYDCGPDNSWEILKQIKKEYPQQVRLIKLSRNYGQHNALICGIEQAEGDFIITMDEDLQQDPDDIKLLIEEQAKSNYDVVYGIFNESNHNTFRTVTSNLFRKIIFKGIPELSPYYSPFRLIKKNIAKSTTEMRNSYTFLDGYLSWITNHIGNCQVTHHNRYAGTSSYTLDKLIEHSINIFVTFSNYPIRLLFKSAMLLFLINICFAIYILIRKFFIEDMAAGYPSLILMISFGISCIMLSLSIIGEYIFRINLKTTKRPNYNIDQII